MKRSEFNTILRQYVKDHLSPTEEERQFVTSIYDALKKALGANSCLQIGSYPRFTAVTPLHDLDVLYILGEWSPAAHNPDRALAKLRKAIADEFKNPTKWRVVLSLQTHSVTVQFLEGQDEKFSVDVVPAYVNGRNSFGGATYMVPEIIRQNHKARVQRYQEIAKSAQQMQWIKSDPRGYIEVAKLTNSANADFRKAVKFVKAWHYSCKDEFDCKLKSFHIEQLITAYFQKRGADIFGAIFQFFVELPDSINKARIADRADPSKFIDEYVNHIDKMDKQFLVEARDCFLAALEEFDAKDEPSQLLTACQRKRQSATEAYLFDQGIPVLTEDPLTIEARVLQRDGGFRAFLLDAVGLIDVDRKIEFRLHGKTPNADVFKWKVKNSDDSVQPRGEITDDHTMNDPEHSKFRGEHYVECYAIRNGICVAKARQNVILRNKWG
jgi:hypothetical protein